MKRYLLIIGLIVSFSAKAQIEGTSIPSLPQLTTAEMTGVISPNIGSSIFNTDDQQVYMYTSSGWVASTDDQTSSEVNTDTPVDVDGDSTTEATVEDVIQAMAPITSKAGRVFYPPSIAIDASVNGTFSINLYTEYTNQYASASMVKNPSAPSAIPVYNANELDYYVTFFDPAVFANISIDDNGLMSYDIIGQPADYNSLINVVFVVK
ncbi:MULTISPECIES: hypothetical protein [Flavobacteriaceae]|uniref:hypothetical protein n=1 Tax=Flavobacteriaceae TaxID=49546 RepID=UPI001FE37725|nr:MULTISPECIES: hypothetical protein [Allomuricauda]MDC6367756.1 hypothetical protein [Muricauda sp. AC10]